MAKNWWFYMLFHHTLIIHKQTVFLSFFFVMFLCSFSFPFSWALPWEWNGRLRDGKQEEQKKIFINWKFLFLFPFIYFCCFIIFWVIASRRVKEVKLVKWVVLKSINKETNFHLNWIVNFLLFKFYFCFSSLYVSIALEFQVCCKWFMEKFLLIFFHVIYVCMCVKSKGSESTPLRCWYYCMFLLASWWLSI